MSPQLPPPPPPVGPPDPQQWQNYGPPPPSPKKKRAWPWVVGVIVLLFIAVGVSSPRQAPPAAPVSPVSGCGVPGGCAKVPNLIGKTRSAASSALDEAGFTGGREQFGQVPEFAVVLAQNPLPGTVMGKGDSVQLTFSADPMAAAVPAAAPAPVPAAPSGPLTTFGSGIYEVGTGDGQVPPGKYKTAGPAAGDYGSCYWARLKDTDGELDSIIANGNTEGPAVVTISKTDGAFETRCTWTKAG